MNIDGICGDETEVIKKACDEIHVCELEPGHVGEHECECGNTWPNADDERAHPAPRKDKAPYL